MTSSVRQPGDACKPFSNSISWRSLPPARNEFDDMQDAHASGGRRSPCGDRFQHGDQLLHRVGGRMMLLDMAAATP